MDVTTRPVPSSLRQQRIRMYSWGLIIAIVIATLITAFQATSAPAPAELAGGDYPAFYGAGVLGANGDWDRLYSFEAQAEAQAGLNETDGSAWYFAYPPPVALPYVPLSRLPYVPSVPSLLIHTSIMAALLLGAVLLARPDDPLAIRQGGDGDCCNADVLADVSGCHRGIEHCVDDLLDRRRLAPGSRSA